jgi:epoxyqueuosine reductase
MEAGFGYSSYLAAIDARMIPSQIRQEARRLGFDAIGFAKVRRLDEHARHLEAWLAEGRHGTMAWMENHFDMRVDPRRLVPGAKSVISLLLSYNQPDLRAADIAATDIPRISLYAQGDDYHTVMRAKLEALFDFMREQVGEIDGRVFVDSAPVLDKAWAAEAGLGWIGKNANLLNRQLGSFFFIGEIISDVDLQSDAPATDHCGSCTRCIDACPTQAIYESRKVDANRCISYLTIELREAIPTEYHEAMGNWMYGCDICQDVCPWNRKAAPGAESSLLARMALRDRDLAFWEELSPETYRELFKGSAMKRTKLAGLARTVNVIAPGLSRGDTRTTLPDPSRP